MRKSDPEIEKRHVIGVDIGGTKTAVSVGDSDGNVITKKKFRTKESPAKVIDEINETIDLFIENDRNNRIKAVGISCGGPLDSVKGFIQSPPNLPGWDEIPVVALLSDHTGLPCFLENDANACALAEWYWGNGKGCSNIIFLTFGTGLGAGIILDGRLYRGTNGLAGEIGHIRLAETGPSGHGKSGSWEGFCSGGGLSRLYENLYGSTLSGKEICMRAKEGETEANEVLSQSGFYLGRGLAILIDILNPERIIIGGIFSRNEALFRTHMEKTLREEALKMTNLSCEIYASGLGEALGDMSAIGVALNQYQSNDALAWTNLRLRSLK